MKAVVSILKILLPVIISLGIGFFARNAPSYPPRRSKACRPWCL